MARPLSHKIVASKIDILVEQRKYLQTFVDETDKVLQLTTSWLSNEDTTNSLTFLEINKMVEDKLAFLVSTDFSAGCEEAATEQEPGATRSIPSAPKFTGQPLPAGHVHVSGVTAASEEIKTVLSQVNVMQDAMSSLSTNAKMLSEKQLAMEKLVESLSDKYSKGKQEKLWEIGEELESIKEKHEKAAIQQDIRMTSFEKKIQAVADSQSDIVKKCYHQQIKIKDNMKETEELKTQSQQFTKDLRDVLENFQELNAEISVLGKRTATNTQIGALEGEIECHKESIEGLSTRLGEHGSLLVELSRKNKETLKVLTSAQKNESEKLKKLEEKLSAVENSWSETTVENGRLYQDVETKLDNVCDQMADLLPKVSQIGHPKGAIYNECMECLEYVEKPKPKPAKSAYVLFLASCRKKATKTGKPPTNITEFNEDASEKWKVLTAVKKKLFESAAAKDKMRYEKEMAIYRGIDPNKPKRPPTAFSFFLGDFRIRMANQGIEYKELLKMAGEEWRSLTSEDKKPYKNKALEKSKKNEPSTSVEHRRIAESSKNASEKEKALTVDEKKLFESAVAEYDKRFEQEISFYKGKSVDPNKPKRKPVAFFVFLGDFRIRMANKGIEYQELLKMAGEEWRSLTSEDKKPYENKALEDSKKHEASLFEYRRTVGAFSGGPAAKKPRVDDAEDKKVKEEDEDDEYDN